MKNLLLLHGALGSKDQFKQLEELYIPDFQIHSINFSGHGRRPSHLHGFTIQNFAHEVLDWMNEKFIQSADIMGYSMGGYVGLWLARFYPERVGKVFTLGTKLNWSKEEADRQIEFLNADKIAEKTPKYAQNLSDMHGEHEWRSVMHKTALLMKDLGHTHLTDQDFIKIQNRVLLAIGDKDNMVSVAETEYVQHLIKNSVIKILPEIPHPLDKVPVAVLKKEMEDFFL